MVRLTDRSGNPIQSQMGGSGALPASARLASKPLRLDARLSPAASTSMKLLMIYRPAAYAVEDAELTWNTPFYASAMRLSSSSSKSFSTGVSTATPPKLLRRPDAMTAGVASVRRWPGPARTAAMIASRAASARGARSPSGFPSSRSTVPAPAA